MVALLLSDEGLRLLSESQRCSAGGSRVRVVVLTRLNAVVPRWCLPCYGDERRSPAMDEKMYVACRQCGEVFDDLTIAHGHAGTCGSDQGWDVVTEDEAF